MIKRIKGILSATVLGMLAICGVAVAETAVNMDTANSFEAQGSIAGSNQGWQFTVNNQITVTHLGLYDGWPNGFSIDHPIGLWRLNDGTLLASGTISAGTVDPLTNHFRYIDVPDVQLSTGVNYVIGYYSVSYDTDNVITQAASLQVNPSLNIVVSRWDASGQFQMPANINTPSPPLPFYPDDFGPNFQFDVPEPATLMLLGIGAIMLRRNRR